jgi:ketosteroid isomerase-like protein
MEPKEVVIAYAAALEKGDIPTAFSYFSTEVQWHQPGNNQFSGVKVGADEISGMIGSMMKVSLGTFALKPNGNLMVNDNLVSMPVNFSGKIDNQVMDMSGVDLFKVEKGKITEVWLFSEDQEKEDSFWGK